MRFLSALTLSALATMFAPPLAAHDLWIEPSNLAPEPGELVRVDLRTGHPGLDGEAVARNPLRLLRFEAISKLGAAPILGQDGVAPAGLLRPTEPGLVTLVYTNTPAEQELPPDRFASYLREEGLGAILALRQERGESGRPGRERYSRSLKALVRVGDAGGEDRPLGLAFELVVEENPVLTAPAEALTFQALFQGQPVAGVLVEAFHLEGRAKPVAAVSDAAGRVRLTLKEQGPWTVTATHMVAVPRVSGKAPGGIDWESFWTSLTFARSTR